MGPVLQVTQANEQAANVVEQSFHQHEPSDHNTEILRCNLIFSRYLQQMSHTVSPARAAEHDRHAYTCIWDSIGLSNRLRGLFRLLHLLIAKLQQQAHDLGALTLGILLPALFADRVMELLQLSPDSLQCQPLRGTGASTTAATERTQPNAVG